MSRKTLIILAAVLLPVAGMIAAAVFGAGYWLPQFPNANFVIAFALGATLTVLLSVGLFALVFISSRRGFDDRAGTGDESEPDQ